MSNEQNELDAKKASDAENGCAIVICTVILSPFAAWWSGFVMLKIYNWFIMQIPGVPVLTIGNMIGISMLLSLPLIHCIKTDKNKPMDEVFSDAVTKMFFYPLVALFYAWLYHRLFM